MGRVIRETGRRIASVEATAEARAVAKTAHTERQAEERLASAREEAAAILAEARDEAARIRADATAEAARELLRRDEADRRERAEALVAREGELVALALAIGERLARKQLADDRSLVVAWIGEALGRLPPTSSARIRLAPSDAALLEDPRIEVDDSLDAGDVVVESSAGRIDARFATRLEAIARVLDETRAR